MNAQKIKFFNDLFLFIFISIMAITGLTMAFGHFKGGKTIFHLTHHQILTIHFFTALILVVLVLIHIILHWNWITINVKNFFKKKAD